MTKILTGSVLILIKNLWFVEEFSKTYYLYQVNKSYNSLAKHSFRSQCITVKRLSRFFMNKTNEHVV